MYLWLHNWLVSHELARFTPLLTLALLLIFAVAVSLVLRFLLRLGLERGLRAISKLRHRQWADVALGNKLPSRLSNLVVPLVISLTAADVPESLNFLQKGAAIAAGIVVALLFNSLAGMANEIYSRHDISKTRPITGVLQITQVVVYLLLALLVIADLMGQRVGVLLGGIGATAAVMSFVFKDPILGFVAGVQLTTNNMLRIGDWITLPDASADGNVIEISMTTVKVRNFDYSVTSIPAYSLVSGAFVNWRAMSDTGARRIKRALHIDAGSVRMLDEEGLKSLAEIDLLRDYLSGRSVPAGEEGEPLNRSTLTNIGTFRVYMQAYIDHRDDLRHDLACMAHQLDPGPQGIPLQVYAFTATADWAKAEGIQADIFEHFFAAAPRFGLRLYQAPSGADVRGV